MHMKYNSLTMLASKAIPSRNPLGEYICAAEQGMVS